MTIDKSKPDWIPEFGSPIRIKITALIGHVFVRHFPTTMAAAVAAAAVVSFTDYDTLLRHNSPTVHLVSHADSQYQVTDSAQAAKRILSPPNTSIRLAAHCWRTPYADYVDYRLKTLDYDAIRITRKVWWRTANELERALEEREIDARRQFWTDGVEPALRDAGYLGDEDSEAHGGADSERVRDIVKQYRGYMDIFDVVLETWATLQDKLHEPGADSSVVSGLDEQFLASLDNMYAACGGNRDIVEAGSGAFFNICKTEDLYAHKQLGRRIVINDRVERPAVRVPSKLYIAILVGDGRKRQVSVGLLTDRASRDTGSRMRGGEITSSRCNKVGTVTGYVRMLTGGDELSDAESHQITLIWQSRWTRTKVLFLLLRYSTAATFAFDTFMTLASGLSTSVCWWDPIFSGIGVVIIIVAVQLILQLRIYAMYNRCRPLLYINGIFFVMEIASALALMFTLLGQGTSIPTPNWIIGSCYGTHPPTIWMIWIPPLIYESYLAALAILKIINEPHPPIPGQRSLLSILVRDSVIYFVFVVSLVAVNAVVFAYKPNVPGVAISGLVDAASSIGGTRMIISIRKAAWSTPDLPTITPPNSMETEEGVPDVARPFAHVIVEDADRRPMRRRLEFKDEAPYGYRSSFAVHEPDTTEKQGLCRFESYVTHPRRATQRLIGVRIQYEE
ncbi:hypothetical protein EXIGLDRAFT_750930 [Exidia glandulosa HHB12029]|uniref:DUF6533 domain-containing protein n=1 Tax=Exidia glandulosa HHB12029 TaxID=1314781 RepID=A0A166A9S7_EXIGL|nr:hypothetical protein EXIGLDRAFT_750930 [Exidia glandulosa HHB12029]